MNEMNEMEILLQTWRPRHPSARCREKIFGECEQHGIGGDFPSPIAYRPKPTFNWLLPVAACLAALLTVFGYSADRLSRNAATSAQSPVIAMVLSNQSLTGYLLGDCRNGQNTLRNTFEWTNASSYTPSIRSLVQ